MDRIWCEDCDQGWVCPIFVTTLNKVVYACVECDVLYEEQSDINKKGMNTQSLNGYIKDNNIDPKDLKAMPFENYIVDGKIWEPPQGE